MAVQADYNSIAQQVYISYFGRPADAVGLNNMTISLRDANVPVTGVAATDITAFVNAYSTDATIKGIIDNFGTSDESTALYGAGASATFVDAIFTQVLGRSPALEGLLFWTNALDSGRMTRGETALRIMEGALNNTTAPGLVDAAAVANKVTAAQTFTDNQLTTADLVGYVGSAAAATARTWLSTVTDDAATLTAATSTVATTITAINTATSTVTTTGTTYTLTTSVDSKTGSTGNDFFDASLSSTGLQTLSSNDSIAGGAGTDTLAGTLTGSAISTANISGIEKFEITATGASSINLAGTSGYTTLINTAGTNTLAYNNISSAAVAGEVRNTTAGSTFNFANAGLSGATDAFGLKVEGAVSTITLTDTAGSNALETIAITAENADATITTLTITDLGATKITIAGDKALTVTTLTDGTAAGATVTNIDASASTANVSIASNAVTGVLTMTGGAGNDTLTANGVAGTSLTGGDGNDVIRIGTADTQFDSSDSIAGGLGNDTVQTEGNTTVLDADFTNVTGVEKLASGSSAGNTLTATLSTLAKAAGVVSVVGGTGADSVTFQSAYDATTVDVDLGDGGNDTVTVDGTTATLIVREVEASLDANDNLTGGSGILDELIVTGGAGSAALDGSFLGFEKITVDNDAAAVSVTLSDDASIASGKNMTVDASAMTSGSFGFTFSAAAELNGKVSVTGGAGADIITLNTTATADTSGVSVSGGAGADSVTMSSEAFTSSDTIVGGAGNDTITIDGAANTAAAVVDADFTNVTTTEFLTLGDDAANAVTLGALALAAGLNKVTLNAGADTVTIGTGYTGAITVAYDAVTSDADTDTVTASGSAAVLTVSGSAAAFATADTFTGGTTTGDTFKIKADSDATGAVFSSADTAFENITIVAGTVGNETVKVTTGGMGASGATLVINAAVLTSASSTFTLDASGETLAAVSVTSGAGSDAITAGAKADYVSGGAGNDTITFATANFTSADTVAGGDGDDTITISNAATVIDADFTNVTSVKTLTVANATAMTAVTLDALAMAAGVTAVKGGTTGALTAVTISSGYTTGTVTVTIGAGNTSADTISAAASTATLKVSADVDDLSNTGVEVLTGGTGTSDELSITEGSGGGGGTLTSAMLATVTAFEKITLATTDTVGTYAITTNDANVASGKNMVVDGSVLTTGSLNFTGTNETNGTFSVTGGAGVDNIYGGDGADTIIGGDGADVLDGGSGADSVTGGAGNDTITIGSATDYADAGADTDTMTISSISSSTFVVDLSATADQLTTFSGAANATVQTGFETVTASGLSGTLTATAAADGSAMTGGTGADTLNGGAGNDSLTGNAGNDSLSGGGGVDTLIGGAGNDTFNVQLSSTGTFDDAVSDSAGTDSMVITGAASAASSRVDLDLTAAGLGGSLIETVDFTALTVAGAVVTGGANATTVLGSDFSDSISGGANTDSLSGGSGADILIGGEAADTLVGGAGADYLKSDGAAGENDVDSVVGGAGDDTFVFNDDGANDVYVEAAGEGTNDSIWVVGNISAATINMNAAGAGTDLQGASGLGIEQIVIGTGNTATFLGLQLTGNTINVTEAAAGTSSLVVTATAAGTTNLSSLTFTAGTYQSSAGATTSGNALTSGADMVVITGAGSAEIIVGTSIGDIIDAGTGTFADDLTGGGGADQFRLDTTAITTIIRDFTDGTDFIVFEDGAAGAPAVNFANTVGTTAGVALAAGDFANVTTTAGVGFAAASVNVATVAMTGAEIIAIDDVDSTLASGTAYLVVFNSTTVKGEIWYDADWDTDGATVQIATLDNITTVGGITALTVADFMLFA